MPGRRALPELTGPEVQVPALGDARLMGEVWGAWADLHRLRSLRHQLRMLEETGAIGCFRIVAERRDEPRSTELPSDSDVYKWVDAASRHLASADDPGLRRDLDAVVELIAAAQAPDGYLGTWVQGLFPGGRFENLELEHEHYCAGHLMEAAVSHHAATGSRRLLDVAVAFADLLVADLWDAPPHRVDGHEEVELALVALAGATGDDRYLELARRLVERRGTATGQRWRFVRSAARTGLRLRRQARVRRAYERAHPDWRRPRVPEPMDVRPTPALVARLVRESVSGREFQTDGPVRRQVEPRGHAVRFLYLQTTLALLARRLGDATLRATTEQAWEAFVDGHMFVSGGAGAVPFVEGFGAAYDLDPRRAYAETCAALAGTFWNRQMALLTGEARYDDLLEWQLLNAAAVGMSRDGTRFTYDNALEVPEGRARREWFLIPCCPSNLSRTWGSLATWQISRVDDVLRLHQLVSARTRLGSTMVEVDSALPWAGEVRVRLDPGPEGPTVLQVRVPGWAAGVEVTVDGEAVDVEVPSRPEPRPTASGVDPRQGRWAQVALPSGRPCEVVLRYPMEVRFHRQDDRVPRVGGRVALSRGPLLYCLEGVDNPGLGTGHLDGVTLDPRSVEASFDPELLGGAVSLSARSVEGGVLRFVPYWLWGNRGATGMTPFVACAEGAGDG